MNIDMKNIAHLATSHDVKRAVAEILHGPTFVTTYLPQNHRPVNFNVTLSQVPNSARNSGTGTLTLPDVKLGQNFLYYLESRPQTKIKVENRQILFSQSTTLPDAKTVQTLEKVFYQDPTMIEARQKTIRELTPQLCVRLLQFGVFARHPRVFSPEWEEDYQDRGNARLVFEYEHKSLRLRTGDHSDTVSHSVVVDLANIKHMAIGREFGNPFILFQLFMPPVLESEGMYRPSSGRPRQDTKRVRNRLGSFNEAHQRVCSFAYQLRLVLKNDDDLRHFVDMCKTAEMLAPVWVRPNFLKVQRLEIFSAANLGNISSWIRGLALADWKVAFQCEALLRNLRLNAVELLGLKPDIDALTQQSSQYAWRVLRHFHTVLRTLRPNETVCDAFARAIEEFSPELVGSRAEVASTYLHAHHVRVTPTATLLEGPYYTHQGNHVLRRYMDYQDFFIRVDFRDESGLQYRWDRKVNGASFVRERFGKLLHDGFEVAGRAFQFLAYSQSQLHEHSVFFVAPFEHTSLGWITASKIRDELADFDDSVRRCPPQYAARISQAFGGTKAAMFLRADQWEEINDIAVSHHGTKRTLTADIGTISRELSKQIWDQLCKQSKRDVSTPFVPVAFQIRFGGYKGTVVVDPRLLGIKMCLRPSMRTFEVHDKREHTLGVLEIAHAFDYPGCAYLNRPLIQILEDLGVPKESFLRLQEAATLDVYTSGRSLSKFADLLESHSLGNSFSLSSLVGFLAKKGCDIEHHDPSRAVATPFLRNAVHTAMESVLRGLKHSARIPVPQSWNLVGVADESGEVLEPGQIYACIWERGRGPMFLEGPVMISRSSAIHPGDVQIVYAIGAPPAGSIFEKEPLPNVVVFPCKGERDLASCLAGGNLGGDLYVVCQCDKLLPQPERCHPPANYPPSKRKYKQTPSTVHDVADFVVEYINSDMFDVLSTQHLILSDQSFLGVFDPGCIELAKLCNKAMKYLHSGTPVNMKTIPRLLISSKPDWKSGEVVNPRRNDYYESTRAIGHLFRAITLDPEASKQKDRHKISSSSQPSAALDAIFSTLEPIIETHLRSLPLEDVKAQLPILFSKYSIELKYICLTSTLSPVSTSLSEEEVVVGTILENCSQPRWRKERIEHMRINVTELVNLVLAELGGPKTRLASGKVAIGWAAWNYARENCEHFGANSFGLIALQAIFSALDELERTPTVLHEADLALPFQTRANISINLPGTTIHFTNQDIESPCSREPARRKTVFNLSEVPNLSGQIVILKDPPRHGGFCDIYLGEFTREQDTNQTEKVAMKMLRLFNRETNIVKAKKKLRREVHLWCSLQHPYVLPFYGTCELDGFRLFMVSPWAAEGDSLGFFRRNPYANRGQLLWQTASALEYLHSGRDASQVVHGDLKADNVLVSADGNALLCDFGLSRHVDEIISMSGSSSGGRVGGHPRFAAPELIVESNDSPSRPTPESDVFAFGSLMLQIYTEKLPFDGISEVQAIFRLAEGEHPARPVDPVVQERGCDDYVWSMMTNCWSLAPSERPSMQEVKKQLAELGPYVHL